ncbi:MAG: hypothetical protein IKV80_04835 [Bacteroidales bacterium]|nr:hypothetical protein [Bacteroidales bacterium]
MKTRTKIIWICLGYLLWGSYAIYTIVQFINGRDGILHLIVGLLMCISLIYLLAYNHHRLLKENKED